MGRRLRVEMNRLVEAVGDGDSLRPVPVPDPFLREEPFFSRNRPMGRVRVKPLIFDVMR